MKIQEMGLDAEIPDDEWFDELRKQLEGYKVRQKNREKKRERERERDRDSLAHSCPCRTRMNFDLFVCVMVQTKGSLSRGSDFF